MSRDDWLSLAWCMSLAGVIVTGICLAYAVAITVTLMLG